VVKPSPLRTKTISTKVSEEEQERLESLAQAEGQSLAEWVRDTLLARAAAATGPTTSAEQVQLAELLALRKILLNVLFKVANGEKITKQEMQNLIDNADADKLKNAGERLSGQAPQVVR
jgi:hypothetical protein